MGRIFQNAAVLIALLLVIGSGVGFYVVSKMEPEEHRSDTAQSIGSVDDLENSTAIKRKFQGSLNWSSMNPKDLVYFRDAIFVGDNASLSLRLGEDTVIDIGENSLLLLDTSVTKDRTGKLGSGSRAGTDVKLLHGQIAVNKSKGTSTSEEAQNIAIVLENNVKINLGQESEFALSKADGKANLLVGKGDITMSVDDEKGTKSLKVAATNPTLMNDLDLGSGFRILDEAELNKKEVQLQPRGSQGFRGTLPKDFVRKRGREMLSKGDLAAIQKEIPDLPPEALKSVRDDLSNPVLTKFTPTPTPELLVTPTPEPAPTPTPLPKDAIPIIVPKKKSAIIKEGVLTLLSPTQNQVFDFTDQLTAIEFSWQTVNFHPDHFKLEMSMDDRFLKPFATLRVTNKEPLEKGGRLATFETAIYPGYMLFVPELLSSIFAGGKVYWRVTPEDEMGIPVLIDERTPVGTISFVTSSKVKLSVSSQYYRRASRLDVEPPNLILKIKAKGVVPGEYRLQIAKDSAYKNILCEKSLPRYASPEGSKAKDVIPSIAKILVLPLEFDEEISVSPVTDCNIADFLKTAQFVYYRIGVKNPALKGVRTENPKDAQGVIQIGN